MRLLARGSQNAFTLANWIMAISLGFAALMSALFITERLSFEENYTGASNSALTLEKLAGVIFLADERLTMSANMAAATGDTAWINRYNAAAPAIDTAIELVTRSANYKDAQEF